MNAKLFFIWLVLGGSALLAAGCREATPLQTSATPFPGGMFTLYQTITPGRTAVQTAINLPTFTPIPTATPTPRTHVIKAGEDMGGIALRYRVPVKDLMAANPTVTPRVMIIGTVLIIPGEAPGAASAGPVLQSTPTLQPVSVEAANCISDPGGGAWCFTRVRNQGQTPLINVTVLLRLVEAGGKEISRQKLALPLDLLPAETTLPIAGFFAPPLPVGFQAGVQLESALQANAVNERYPKVQILDSRIGIAADGVSADATGRATLGGEKVEANQLVILAVAYSSRGDIIGLRRWDHAQALRSNTPVDFQLRVYAMSGLIARVELFAEARK